MVPARGEFSAFELKALRVFQAETRLTVYRRRQSVWSSICVYLYFCVRLVSCFQIRFTAEGFFASKFQIYENSVKFITRFKLHFVCPFFVTILNINIRPLRNHAILIKICFQFHFGTSIRDPSGTPISFALLLLSDKLCSTIHYPVKP